MNMTTTHSSAKCENRYAEGAARLTFPPCRKRETFRDLSIRPYRRPYGRKAFSLVELLVVIGIIVLLVGILVPSISRAYINAKLAQARANIALIEGGCEMYKTDFDEYPASTGMNDPGGSAMTGAQMLVVYMTGYADDGGTKGLPEGSLSDDDGNDGFGFRPVRRGKVYGPYNGCEEIPTNGETPPSFVNDFIKHENPIYYFRWTGSNFDDAHNDNDISQSYLNTADDSRRDFLLWSAGPNGEIDDPNDPSAGEDFDDVTNFD